MYKINVRRVVQSFFSLRYVQCLNTDKFVILAPYYEFNEINIPENGINNNNNVNKTEMLFRGLVYRG